MSKPIRTVAVIDIGKTHAKLIVVDAESGNELASRKIANRVVSGAPYPHYDTDALWRFIQEGLAGLNNGPGYQAISITTHGASAALLNASGELAMPVLDYEFTFPDQIIDAYEAMRPEFAETFSPRLTGGLNLGAQLHYQRACFPEAFASVSTILTYPQYWAHRLTGIAANEATSLGCHTDLWRPFEGDYSSLVARLGIADLMAPIRSAFDVLGQTTPTITRQLGLAAPVPVYCGIHDSNASLLPHLVGFGLPCTVVSTGTWVVCFAAGGQADDLDENRDTLVNVDAFGKPVPSARYMGGREWEIITKGLEQVAPDPEWIAVEDVIAKGQMLLPSVVSGTGPFPGATGGWRNEPQTDEGRRAAASLYQALMTMTCLDLIGSRGPIVVEGPFAANKVFRAALSTLSGRDVYASASHTGTSLGASFLTGTKSNVPVELVTERIADLDTYAKRWRETAE
ncbi:carbohydrate kinase [Agrobacterium tumefaciens]|uniref:Carbohydrate kinase n=1 Tax=Agrobacterium cavarae TaxID=2528239 RepID=A0ABY1Y968_9HYPH|nr:FGGY-family carbohydrate kinase [Agrobacterium cavarae]MQB22511.1 carbohydrate kinase [Agrobacterium tumefaciens]TBN12703.1 carbohydrate kinase [Agrobacterium cavarae]